MKAPTNIQLLGRGAGLVLAALILSACATNGEPVEEIPPSKTIQLPQLSDEERDNMGRGDKEAGEAMQTGIGRELPENEQNIALADLDWKSSGSRREAHIEIHSPEAESLRLGMRYTGGRACELNLRFEGSDGEFTSPMSQRRLVRDEGVWWSPVTPGDTVRVHLDRPDRSADSGCVLTIPQLSHIY